MLSKRQDLPKPYPNPYNEGEYFSPSDVQRGQELISSNIPLGLGSAPTSPMTQPTRMPTMIPSPMSQPIPEQQDDDSGRFLASLIAQGAAGFGTGISGGSAADIQRSAGTFQTMRDTQENQRRAKLLTDPTSEESKKRREVYKSLGYKVPNNLSATDLNDPTVLQTLKTQMQEQKLAAMPRGGIGVSGEGKAKEKKNPFQKEITEISIRSKNALDSLNKIENIVTQYGTRELTGSQEKELEQLIQNVAVNYNKVLDPTSVVREGEAKQVAESLGLGGFGSYFTNKDTALKQVQSFRNLVTNSRNNALSGYSNLPSDTDFDEKDQFVIDEYRKNPNDPKVKELYNDMLRSKGLR
jgi:hypothetical protein